MWRKMMGHIILILSVIPANGQSQDCINVHFDKSFYVAGETLWFKAYLSNDSELKSKVLHVDLVSHQNQTIATQKLIIENSSSFGSITLPNDTKEGHYRFRAYTRYNLNFQPPHIYQKTIPVYQLKQRTLLSIDSGQAATPNIVNSGINIAFDKNVYQPRDSLRVSLQFSSLSNIQNTQGIGNLSVSVVPLDIAKLESNSIDYTPCTNWRLKNDPPVAAERFLHLQGRLLDPITKSDANHKLITIYLDKAPQLIKAYVEKGAIKIPVYDYWGTGEFHIMNLDPNNTTEFEFVSEPDSTFNVPYYNTETPSLTPTILNYLSQLEKRRKIMELFDQKKSPEVKFAQPPGMIPDATYRTEEYKDIYSFEEFINEAIGNVKVRSINGLRSIRLFNKEAGDPFPQHPWYIVDGYTTFNEKEVLDIQYQDIVELRLYSRSSTLEQYFKHFMWNRGVLEVITRDVKYSRNLKNNVNVVQVEGFTPAQRFDSTLNPPLNWTTPELRGVIYWAPDVFSNKQGLARITIPLSDDTGQFAIVVKGTSYSKRLIQGFSTFEVKVK